MSPQEILDFWFSEITPAQWYKSDPTVDASIRRRFEGTYRQLHQAVPSEWQETPHAVLAAIIVLDQFPRNMFRGTPQAFAADDKALSLATQAIDKGLDHNLSSVEKQFLYMPFQHAENRSVQARSLKLFATVGDSNVLNFAKRHSDIIERFGRFPHRNAILGRKSTPEESEFLKQPGSSF